MPHLKTNPSDFLAPQRITPSLIKGLLLAILLLPAWSSRAQQASFDVVDYEAFQRANEGISAGDLMALHPAGSFLERIAGSFDSALYSDSLASKFTMTADEMAMIDKHGFVVSERLSYDSFGRALHDIYAKDLPVFISTDAILHAFHMSYDSILKETEETVLIPKLDALLVAMHAAVADLDSEYASVQGMEQPLRDLDVYINVARRLLGGAPLASFYPENEQEIQTLMAFIASEQGFVAHNLFAENCRLYDFSQFTPRGHYTQSEELTRYFQAMIWLGRTEIYLSAPATRDCKPSEGDVQRQTVMALLAVEAIEAGNAATYLEEIDTLIQLFVGESDNVTHAHLQELRTMEDVDNASDLLDDDRFNAFQETLLDQAWSMQRIQSQMLVNGDLESGNTQPASAFLLVGQRFVIDSYVTGLVVYDKISSGARRMLPDPLDVLFALGNDAAAQLLPELDAYAPDLAALRYIVDSYEEDFWRQSLYNGWLNSIKTLNPPAEAERQSLPPFMQTAAWWQEKMNTQLAGWAQLRHDNLLYAKQSYSGIPLCHFPYSYVEPIPEFYRAASLLGNDAADKFRSVGLEDAEHAERVISYFETFAGVNDTLAVIAQKELAGTPFTEEEDSFLKRVIFDKPSGCYISLAGWYTRLYYDGEFDAKEADLVVADIHTSPADASGNIVGWVLHVGTGPLNMAVVTADVPGEGEVAFVGPVMSYYEHVSTGFERLTDEVWATAYAAEPTYRPEFVNLYLADRTGASRSTNATLRVGIEQAHTEGPDAGRFPVLGNYPNPFRGATSITFALPVEYGQQRVALAIYDIQGREVGRLVDEALPAGNYSVRWDGMLDSGARAASGVYYARLRVGDREVTRPMAVVR